MIHYKSIILYFYILAIITKLKPFFLHTTKRLNNTQHIFCSKTILTLDLLQTLVLKDNLVIHYSL